MLQHPSNRRKEPVGERTKMISWCGCGKAIDNAVWEAMPLVGIMTQDGDPIPPPPDLGMLAPGCLVLKNCSCRSTISRETSDPTPGSEVGWPVGSLRLPPIPGLYQWRPMLDDRVRHGLAHHVDAHVWDVPPTVPEDPNAYRCGPVVDVSIKAAPKRYPTWDKATGQEMLDQLQGFRSALMGGKSMAREAGFSSEQIEDKIKNFRDTFPGYTLDELAAAQREAQPLQDSLHKAYTEALEKEYAAGRLVASEPEPPESEETPSWRARHGWPEPKPAACSCGCDEHAMLSEVDCPKCGHWIPKDSEMCKADDCTEWALSESPWCRNHLPDEVGQ